MSKLKQINPYIFKILSVFLGISFALCISEVALRAFNYDYVPIRIQQLKEQDKWREDSQNKFNDDKNIRSLGRTDWRHFHQLEDEYVVYDNELIWRPKKNFVVFNEQGFKGPNVSAKKNSSEIRIVALGDSNTAGPFRMLGWPGFLEKVLTKNNYNVKVLNAGVWGYTSYQGVIRFKEMLKYEPDIVIICFGSNDAHMVPVSDKDYLKSKEFYKSVSHFKLCKLLFFIIDSITARKKGLDSFVHRVSQEDYRRNLKAMITLSRQNNIQVVLLTRPFIGESHHKLWWKNFAPQYNEIIRETAENEKVLLIDTYDYFKDKEPFFLDEGHFTDGGNIVAAQYIYKGLINSPILKILKNIINTN